MEIKTTVTNEHTPLVERTQQPAITSKWSQLKFVGILLLCLVVSVLGGMWVGQQYFPLSQPTETETDMSDRSWTGLSDVIAQKKKKQKKKKTKTTTTQATTQDGNIAFTKVVFTKPRALITTKFELLSLDGTPQGNIGPSGGGDPEAVSFFVTPVAGADVSLSAAPIEVTYNASGASLELLEGVYDITTTYRGMQSTVYGFPVSAESSEFIQRTADVTVTTVQPDGSTPIVAGEVYCPSTRECVSSEDFSSLPGDNQFLVGAGVSFRSFLPDHAKTIEVTGVNEAGEQVVFRTAVISYSLNVDGSDNTVNAQFRYGSTNDGSNDVFNFNNFLESSAASAVVFEGEWTVYADFSWGQGTIISSSQSKNVMTSPQEFVFDMTASTLEVTCPNEGGSSTCLPYQASYTVMGESSSGGRPFPFVTGTPLFVQDTYIFSLEFAEEDDPAFNPFPQESPLENVNALEDKIMVTETVPNQVVPFQLVAYKPGLVDLAGNHHFEYGLSYFGLYRGSTISYTPTISGEEYTEVRSSSIIYALPSSTFKFQLNIGGTAWPSLTPEKSALGVGGNFEDLSIPVSLVKIFCTGGPCEVTLTGSSSYGAPTSPIPLGNSAQDLNGVASSPGFFFQGPSGCCGGFPPPFGSYFETIGFLMPFDTAWSYAAVFATGTVRGTFNNDGVDVNLDIAAP